jgi:hypothetical protein
MSVKNIEYSKEELKEMKREQSKTEVLDWLKTQKKVKESKLDAYEMQVNTLIDAVENGDAYIKDSEFVVKLQFPINSAQGFISEIAFKPRVTVNAIQMQLQGVKSDDSSGRVWAYIAASTGINKAILKNIDNVDQENCEAVGVFFHT